MYACEYKIDVKVGRAGTAAISSVRSVVEWESTET